MPKYDNTKPTTAEYWLSDWGASRPTNEPLLIIAATGLAAFEFAIEVATARGLSLSFIEAKNLND